MQALNLILVMIGNSLQRIAAGASGVLVGLYLAQIANCGSGIGAGPVEYWGRFHSALNWSRLRRWASLLTPLHPVVL
jgi:hypothetical protein